VRDRVDSSESSNDPLVNKKLKRVASLQENWNEVSVSVALPSGRRKKVTASKSELDAYRTKVNYLLLLKYL